MCYVSLLFMLFAPEDTVLLKGLYAPPDAHNTVITDDGSIFALSDHHILKFSPEGTLLHSFSGAGNGPGELTSPLKIGRVGNHLWVYDWGKHSVLYFSLNGTYAHMVQSPHIATNVLPVPDGLISLLHHYGRPDPAQLFFIDANQPDQVSLLHSWKPTYLDAEKTFTAVPKTVPFVPVREGIWTAVNAAGTLAYLIPPGETFKILVFDVQQRAWVRTIERPETPLPFNKDWAEEKMRQAARDNGTHFRLTAPDTFPIVKGFRILGDTLIIEKWTYMPEAKRAFTVLNQEGEEVPAPFDPVNLGRLVHVTDTRAYLSGYDQDADQAQLLICPLEDMDTVIAAHPVVLPKPKPFIRLK